MKKIGCVIAYKKNHNNYGTSLQGYATVKTLENLGYECEIIIYHKQLSFFDKTRLVIFMFLIGDIKNKFKILKNKLKRKLHNNYTQNITIRTKSVNMYKKENLEPFFKTYVGYKNLCEGALTYDAVLVGSDQVWVPMSLYSRFTNLLFVNDRIPKIAYASSFGVSKIPAIQKNETRKYLNRFNKIGVRELKGKEIVETISDSNATVVVDPTILLTKNDWQKEIDSSNFTIEKEPFIFCYLLGPNIEARRAANELKQYTGFKIIAIRHMDEYILNDEDFGDEAPYNVSPNDFIKLISQAEYVCTDSFHCTVFSIIFQKKFMTFYRYNSKNRNSRNSRIDSLFSLLSLSDRLYQGQNIVTSIKKEINYTSVDNKLSELRNDSLAFLKSALSF